MEEISRSSEGLRVGEYVRISSYKFPELHPRNMMSKSVTKTPFEMEEIQFECNAPGESIVHFRKNALFEYKLLGLDYIGMEGVIIKLRNKAECEYEKITGDIAKYVVKIKSNLLSWKNKIATLYPSQVEKIKKLTHKDIENEVKRGRITKKNKTTSK